MSDAQSRSGFAVFPERFGRYAKAPPYLQQGNHIIIIGFFEGLL
jgi:hypothetical protein